MHTIGLVGGIASGKSAVAAELSKLGATVLDADAAAHKAINLPEVKDSLVERWGQGVVGTSGTIDRQAVARIVFGEQGPDQSELNFLESLLHPLLRGDFEQQLKEHLQAGTAVVVIDAPLLLEAGWRELCDSILFIEASTTDRYERAERRNWTEEEFARRELAQMSIKEKRSLATHVIANDGSLQALERAVGDFWRQISSEKQAD